MAEIKFKYVNKNLYKQLTNTQQEYIETKERLLDIHLNSIRSSSSNYKFSKEELKFIEQESINFINILVTKFIENNIKIES